MAAAWAEAAFGEVRITYGPAVSSVAFPDACGAVDGAEQPDWVSIPRTATHRRPIVDIDVFDGEMRVPAGFVTAWAAACFCAASLVLCQTSMLIDWRAFCHERQVISAPTTSERV